ncbi:hypothetical protein [Infirmifilum sp.]|jgi:hypothetical protein|uniref:hypothetical protein n=1 Tax=Infirmifilum sp. TaxID=2856575 RepID=UPI003D0F2CD6
MSVVKEHTVRCPHCGAEFQVPLSASRVTCPYCFTVFDARELTVKEENHYYFPLSKTLDPFEKLVKFISRQYAVPIDLPKSFTVDKRELYWVPVYFFFADVTAEARGHSNMYGEQTSEIRETRLVSIPASGTWLDEILNKYPFPVRGKLPFNPEITSRGLYLNPALDGNAAQKKVEQLVTSKVRLEASESFNTLYSVKIIEKKIENRGLIHYPIWVLGYNYNGRSYQAIVDGASGIVIHSEYPQTVRGRISLAVYALLSVVMGVAGALLYSYLVGEGFLALLGGLVVGGATALPALTRSATRVARASEYMEFR